VSVPRRFFRRLFAAALVALFAVSTRPSTAQGLASVAKKATEPAPSASAQGEEEPIAPDSPRASMTRFLELVRSRHFKEASQYLDVPKDREADGPALARRLIEVLDRDSWLDPDTLSPKPSGDLEDGLPSNYEKIGGIPEGVGPRDPVLLVRQTGKSDRWVFSLATVGKIDGWYDELEDKWFLEHLPPFLLRLGPRNLLLWQWIALPILLILSGIAGGLVNWAARRVLLPLVKRTKTPWDDAIVERLRSQATLAWALVIAYFAIPYLSLYQPAEEFVHQLLRGLVLFDFFWAASRLIDVVGEMVLGSSWGMRRLSSRGLISLGVQVTKLVVVAFAVVASLSSLGYPVTSIIAGLGIGGLAVALAAQKTVENLFGAFSISADEPFREGDFIKVDGITGNVLRIGLRSTRIRTPDRTVITLPNGKLADMRVESYAPRDQVFFSTTLRLAEDTSSSAMREILSGLEALLAKQPKVAKESVVARFSQIGQASLDIDVSCLFETRDFGEFQLLRQNLLLEIMELVEKAHTSFARPTSILHLADGTALATPETTAPSNRNAAPMNVPPPQNDGEGVKS